MACYQRLQEWTVLIVLACNDWTPVLTVWPYALQSNLFGETNLVCHGAPFPISVAIRLGTRRSSVRLGFSLPTMDRIKSSRQNVPSPVAAIVTPYPVRVLCSLDGLRTKNGRKEICLHGSGILTPGRMVQKV